MQEAACAAVRALSLQVERTDLRGVVGGGSREGRRWSEGGGGGGDVGEAAGAVRAVAALEK